MVTKFGETMPVARSRRSDAVFKALSDPTRREIIALLRDRRRSVGDLASNFTMSRPAVSKHLRVLRGAGIVVDRLEGTTRVCELDPAPLQHVDSWLAAYKTFWDRSLIRLKATMEDDR